MNALPLLPDLIEPGLSVVFCGINPGLRAASTGYHFEGRGNRFWRVMHLAGFTPGQIRPEDDHSLLRYGCGLTTVVARPTARAAELSREEIEATGDAFRLKIERNTPRHVAFLGKMAFSAISNERKVEWGLQADRFCGAQAWVLPNPSGLNRGFDLDALVAAYRTLCVSVEPVF